MKITPNYSSPAKSNTNHYANYTPNYNIKHVSFEGRQITLLDKLLKIFKKPNISVTGQQE